MKSIWTFVNIFRHDYLGILTYFGKLGEEGYFGLFAIKL